MTRRLDEPAVDPESQAEAPDETIQVERLPSWMRRMPQPVAVVRSEEVEEPAPREAEWAEVDWQRLPRWMRGWPQRGREEEERQAADGAKWDHRDELPPEE